MDDATRFQEIRNRKGVRVERNHTKRTTDTYLKCNGVLLASRHEVSVRGKLTSTTYQFYGYG